MAQTTAEQAVGRLSGDPPRRSSTSIAGLVCLGGAIAVVIAVGLIALTGARPLQNLGLPDPGTFTTLALPAVRTVAEASAVLTIGFLLFAVFLVPPQRSGYLDVAGFRGLRAASYSAAAWAASAFLLVPLTGADAIGRPVAAVLDVGLIADLLDRLDAPFAWLLTGIVALLVLIACRLVLSWGWTVLAFGLSLLGPLPVALTGHSAAGGSHDVATNSLLWHVFAAGLWVGGLVAVLTLAAARTGSAEWPDGVVLGTAVRRFSRIALWCWIVLAVTGVLNAVVRIPVGELFGSAYGWLLWGKVAALVLLGALGAVHRMRTVDAAARGERQALLRLGAVEVLVMFATIGLAVALGRSSPPATGAPPPSRVELLLGYDLAGPPTFLRLAFDWRFDLVYGTLALLLATLYVLAVLRLRRRGDAWPVGRTIGWLSGCAALLIGTSSGIGKYAPAMFSVHMGLHMILAMLVPILLVLGGPVTLALRALPVAGREAPPGPREWLLAALHSPLARWLTNPLFTLAFFVGSYYFLYFSGLFAWSLDKHWPHLAMNAHFLLAGVLFFWPLIGIDPAPRRLPAVARLGLVFASVPFHAFFGVALMAADTVIGDQFYRALALPWVPNPLADQQTGGGIAWGSGELPLLIVVLALLVQWARLDERSARRDDRRADADGEADLEAYNAMLRRLATGEGASGEAVASSGISAEEPTSRRTTGEHA